MGLISKHIKKIKKSYQDLKADPWGEFREKITDQDPTGVLGKDITDVLDALNPITLLRPGEDFPEAPKPSSEVPKGPDLLFRRRANRGKGGFRSLMVPLTGQSKTQIGLGIPT